MPVHSCIPGSKGLAPGRHRQTHQCGEDQSAEQRDVGHRQIIVGDKRLLQQNGIEIVHASQGVVALFDTPPRVLIDLDLGSQPRRGMVE